VNFPLEVVNRSAAAFTVEPRHPFMDKRLIEFCLALPPEQKLKQGWSRIVMRRAMQDILPKSVQWRGGKVNFNINFVRKLRTFDREIINQVIHNDLSRIEPYVNINHLHEAHHRLMSPHPIKLNDAITVWKAVTLALWLRYIDTRETHQLP
jgi:asparagine synthase (glutamine-hydrolysing)